jgi:ATP-dependent helicase/nuclease subunit A
VPSNGRLPFDAEPVAAAAPALPDAAARDFATDPHHNCVLQASAGTGKTRVLVDRYVNLLLAGVEPESILAITFTRKAAAEMRERIVGRLRELADAGTLSKDRWRALRARLGEIAISTIDAFCLALLREFPLEADVDPGFDLADETQVPRLMDEALDQSLRICRAQARTNEQLSLVFAQLSEFRLRQGLQTLLHRRLVAPAVLHRFLARTPADLTIGRACRQAGERLIEVLSGVSGGFDGFLADAPDDPGFDALALDLRRLRGIVARGAVPEPGRLRALLDAVDHFFFTQNGDPRKNPPATKKTYSDAQAWARHKDAIATRAGSVDQVLAAFSRDLNALLARGVRHIYAIVEATYRRTLTAHAVLDFTEVLERASSLLAQMDEFAQSRYRLESRYHHVLLDEFQDTSRAQWMLVEHLVRSWGEGFGLASTGPLLPTIFTVSDRKQSIYNFRDADVRVVRHSTDHICALRPDQDPRRAISVSFRAVPELLAFVNDICAAIPEVDRPDAFEYHDADRFPIMETPGARDALGLVVAEDAHVCAEAVAEEIVRLLASGAVVRDRQTGVPRPVKPDDIAILFRQRAGHQFYEEALERRRVRTYVYKGLGFFESEEVMDLVVLLRFLADPHSDLRAAAFLRSRFVRLSDESLGRLAPGIARALMREEADDAHDRLDPSDRQALILARAAAREWARLADQVTPAELLDRVLDETGYAYEMRGPRWPQARENVKKFRALVRRVQNRGYATLGRVAAHLETLSLGDESNAVIDAVDAVNLMTIHAAKGLEFPVVFVVNLAKAAGGAPPAVRVLDGDENDDAPLVSIESFDADVRTEAMARELEESKRLLYVALTRARDRLYLAASRRGKPDWKWGVGGLGAVLPEQFRGLIEASEPELGATPQDVAWPAGGGSHHRLRVCPLPVSAAEDRGVPDPDDLAGIPGGPYDATAAGDVDVVRRLPVTTWLSEAATAGADPARQERRRRYAGADDRLTGTLVHRLLQVSRQDEHLAGLEEDALRDRAADLLRADERVAVEDPEQVIDRAATLFRAMANRPELMEAPASGERFDEVPFSYRVDPLTIVRGAIDRLVAGADWIVAYEFKTGAPKPEHRRQLALYLDALRARDPDATVDGHVIYPRAPERP